MDLTCPKCSGTMRNYERNGVHVDQCADCRGIFLDRGELERLVDAENSWHGSAGSNPAPQPQSGQPRSAPQSGYQGGFESGGYSSGGPGGGYSQEHYPKRKKKKSFLDELFD